MGFESMDQHIQRKKMPFSAIETLIGKKFKNALKEMLGKTANQVQCRLRLCILEFYWLMKRELELWSDTLRDFDRPEHKYCL